ncbi:MAG: hypothetical protein EZS28_024060, partial [Streblomastix strix]
MVFFIQMMYKGSPFQGSPVVMCGIIFGYNFHLPAFMLQPKVFLQVL